MGRMIEHSITCYCENTITTQVPEIIDLSSSPETAEKIISGDFLKIVCDRCGKELKPEFELRFAAEPEGIDLYFLPELERESFYKGEKEIPDDKSLVIGYRELREFFLMRSYGLKRIPLEAIKLHLLQKAPADAKLEIFFEKQEDDILLFHVYGLRKDEVGVVKIPMTSYAGLVDDQERLREEEPYSAMFRGPYVSVNLISFEEETE